MRSPIPAASLSLLLLTMPGVWAQTADDFFHGGAQEYLSNNIAGAKTTVTNGLLRYPEDKKLKKLYELLNQQQQQNQPDQQKQQQDQQKKDEEKKKDQQQQQQQAKNDQEKKDQQKQQEEQKKKGDDKSREQPNQPKDNSDPRQVAAHAMTPQEAKQLLDAQKGDEQVLIFQPEGEPKNRTKPLKDW
jgi:outer membrane biosynthesis protein TonB